MKDSIFLKQAAEHGQHGDAVEAEKLIFNDVEPDCRVKSAHSIIDQVVSRAGAKLSAIESLGLIAKDPSKWGEAHSMFSKLRAATSDLERLKKLSSDQELLLAQLYLAENVAKVVYNAADPSDPFDEDSGWWLVACLKRVTDLLKDGAFSEAVWKNITGERYQPQRVRSSHQAR